MSLRYKLVEKVNPINRTEKSIHAAPVNDGKIDIEFLAEEIVGVSSLSRSDVYGTIMSLIDIIPKYLLMGKSINLGELGTLRISYGSKPVKDAGEFHVNLIKNVKLIFTPSTKLKALILKAHFEQAHDIKNTHSVTGGGNSGGGGIGE